MTLRKLFYIVLVIYFRVLIVSLIIIISKYKCILNVTYKMFVSGLYSNLLILNWGNLPPRELLEM